MNIKSPRTRTRGLRDVLDTCHLTDRECITSHAEWLCRVDRCKVLAPFRHGEANAARPHGMCVNYVMFLLSAVYLMLCSLAHHMTAHLFGLP